jgi:hypothetical protein
MKAAMATTTAINHGFARGLQASSGIVEAQTMHAASHRDLLHGMNLAGSG